MSRNKDLSLVSIVIPTYNRSRLLRLAVESVLAQTYPNIETIVIDDGSTDDTAAVMAEYAGRIIYIRQEENQGAAKAIEIGFQAASGEYIGSLDHDDLFMPTKIERQVQVLDTRPEIGLCYCGYNYIDENGNLLQNFCLLPGRDFLKELVLGNFIWSGAPLTRRQCLEAVGLPNEDIWCGDWDQWLRIALAGYQFHCIQEPLGSYRILSNSQMSNVPKLEHGVVTILDKVFATPHLPAEVTAVKSEAYGRMRFQLSCWYSAAGLWGDARRNLTKALAWCPQWLECPQDLLQLVVKEALNLRTSDPVRFIVGMFDHLPPAAEVIGSYRMQALAQVYTCLAFRLYATETIVKAKRQLGEAIDVYPGLLDQAEDFANLLSHEAMRLPVGNPLLYVETVLENLPAGARQLERVRSRVLSDVNIACAFQDYSAGYQSSAARRIFTGVLQRPSWLKNRGVVSVFLRSLAGLLTESRESRFERQRDDSRLVPSWR
jgi:hypothetical protein